MIKINDTYYELDVINIITELKEQLASNGIFLFNQIKDLPDDIMVSCPFHKDGQERKASCGIRKNDGFLHCFTCGETCSIEQLISRCFGKDDFGQFGINWLAKNFLGEIFDKRDFQISFGRRGYGKSKIIEDKFITEIELDKYRYYHPYMYKRKMTDDVINLFDIGFDKDTNCITFPVRDENGNCLFIARRSVIGKFFNYPNDVEKPVYGLFELPKDVDEIIICESMINAITCYVYGKPAVALNGTGTDYQIQQLRKLNCRKLILALDSDAAGMKGTDKLIKTLRPYKIVTQLEIPSGKDINDLTKDEFENLFEKF